MVRGGQAFSREPGVSRGFVPTDAAYRKIRLPIRVSAQPPRGGPWLAGFIPKLGHRLFPGKGLAGPLKWLFPIVAFPIAPLIHKLFELAVRDLETVDPKSGNPFRCARIPIKNAPGPGGTQTIPRGEEVVE